MRDSNTLLCVIDDDDIYKFTFTKNLERVNFKGKTIMFSDGEEAIEFFDKHFNETDILPDIIFLDINMPVMDGFQFMEEFVKIKPKVGKKITVYIVTSSVDPMDLEKAHRINEVSDYLVKPIEESQVLKILETL